MFDTLANLVPKPVGVPDRAWRLDTYRRVLNGTIYDVLPFEFYAERSNAGDYIPLRQRKPSVRYALCKIVVEDSISFLFGEGRFPAVECADKSFQDELASLLFSARITDVFSEAAMIGSVGSVAILFRVLNGRVFLSALTTNFLTPAWRNDAPDTLASVTEAYQVKGRNLRDAGYEITDLNLEASFWYRRTWTDQDETWFAPQTVDDASKGLKPSVDATRSVHHGLGFVPMVWIANLPGGIAPDGECTFRPAVDTAIEIDYQLSQAGRGLKYSSDPTLLLKEPAATEGENIIRSASDALVVSEKGDAKLLEINGTAANAVIEYVKSLREFALESVHGNRANADKLASAQSGRAMELLYVPLLNLVDRLRSSYGRGLLDVAKMIASTAARMPITVDDETVKIGEVGKLTLRWPPFFAPTQIDMRDEATTLGALRREGLISRDTAVRRVAATHDIGDVDEELKRIVLDEAETDARMKRQGAQIKDQGPAQA